MRKYIKLKYTDTVIMGDEIKLPRDIGWTIINNLDLVGKRFDDAFWFLSRRELVARRKNKKLRLG